MNPDDQELRTALALLADDSDPAADIAATVRTRLHRRDRLRRTAAIGSLAAAVVATLTFASVVSAPGRGDPAPIGAAPSSPPPATTAATAPASSGAAVSPAIGEAPSAPATTPDGERINQVFISCYATPDVENPEFRNYLGLTLGGGSGSASEAIASCTRLWDEGTLSSEPPYVLDQPSNPIDPVIPELSACGRSVAPTPGEPEVPTTETVVLPGDPGICERLGLEVPSE